MDRRSSFTFIGIAGGSAGGKTTFARLLHRAAGDGHASILELDRFYLPKSDRLRLGLTNFDQPDAIDLSLVEQVVVDLKQRGRAEVPIYDFATHDRIGFETIAASRLIIVEGILALWSASLRDQYDWKIYVDAPTEHRLARRIDRDGRERGREPDSVRQQWFDSVLPMHQRFVEPTKTHADRILDGCSDLDQAATSLLTEIMA